MGRRMDGRAFTWDKAGDQDLQGNMTVQAASTVT